MTWVSVQTKMEWSHSTLSIPLSIATWYFQVHSGDSFGDVSRLRESFGKIIADDMWLWTAEQVSSLGQFKGFPGGSSSEESAC